MANEQTFLVTHKTRVTVDKADYEWDMLTAEERVEIVAETAAASVLDHEPVEVVGLD